MTHKTTQEVTHTSRPSKFKQEISRERIMLYLKFKAATKQPIKIFYKEEEWPTIFYDYKFDNKYLYVPSGKGYDYKYLIERIRNVEQ